MRWVHSGSTENGIGGTCGWLHSDGMGRKRADTGEEARAELLLSPIPEEG